MDKNKLSVNASDAFYNTTRMKLPMTLEYKHIMIKDSYFDAGGDFIVDLRLEFLVNREELRVLNKRFKISQDDAWGMTLDERRMITGRAPDIGGLN